MEYASMTGQALRERQASAYRRMDRYQRMGNAALFAIAQQERNEVEAVLRRRAQPGPCPACSGPMFRDEAAVKFTAERPGVAVTVRADFCCACECVVELKGATR